MATQQKTLPDKKTVITKSCLLKLAISLGHKNNSVLKTIKKVMG
jgi:hypothetical protein